MWSLEQVCCSFAMLFEYQRPTLSPNRFTLAPPCALMSVTNIHKLFSFGLLSVGAFFLFALVTAKKRRQIQRIFGIPIPILNKRCITLNIRIHAHMAHFHLFIYTPIVHRNTFPAHLYQYDQPVYLWLNGEHVREV